MPLPLRRPLQLQPSECDCAVWVPLDDLAGPLGQDDEDVKGATADVKRRAILFQKPGLGKEAKWPK